MTAHYYKLYDIVIIGGGITGTAIARELSRYRVNIALLEKEEELAFGVSKSNSGIIHPGTQNPPGSLKGKLCVAGNRLVRKIARQLGIDFKTVGELIVAFDEADIGRLRQLKKEARKLGVKGLRIVGPKWLRKHEPNLSREVVAALYAPSAGIISPYRFVYDMSENAKMNGVEIFTGALVKDIKVLSSGQPGQRLPNFEVATGQKIFKTRYIINAAGLYADAVARMVQVNDFTIQPRKGEEFLLDKKRENITKHLIFPLPSRTSKGVLVIRTSDGNPMIGPTAQDVDDKEDRSTSDEGLEQVISSVKRMVPSISGRDIIAYFAGLRPVAGEDFIIRYEQKVPGFVNVAGIQSPGLTAAPAIAIYVRQLLKKNGLRLKRKWRFQRYRPQTVHLFASDTARTKELIAQDPSYGDIVCRCEMVSAKEIRAAVSRGAQTLDGIKFRTRAQAGRCHGGFCTTRIMKILSEETSTPLTEITKRGPGSEIVRRDRADG